MNAPRYTAEFKRSAAALVQDQNYTYKQACQALGVGETALRRWVTQLQREHQGITPKAAAMTTDQRRIQELEQRIYRIEREKEILKKAIALLMPATHKP